MGYDNKGAWTDLINGVDYVDAKDINNLAHKEQELEAIVKEKAYKKGEKIILSKENDIVFKDDEHLNFDKDNFDIPNLMIGKDNFMNNKAGFKSQNICNTLISCSEIYGNSNAIMEDCIGLSISGNSNAIIPTTRINLGDDYEFTLIENGKYKLKALSNTSILKNVIDNERHIFIFLKNEFNPYTAIPSRYTQDEVLWERSEEDNTIIIDMNLYLGYISDTFSIDNIKKEDLIIYVGIPYHNSNTWKDSIKIIGNDNTAISSKTYILGNRNVSYKRGYALGEDLFIDSSNALYIGRGNSYSLNNTKKNVLVAGGGTSALRINAFRVEKEGSIFAQKEYNSTGADYAEYFEWKDGNPNDEDRVGYFVTLDGDKISIAKEGDWILGVVSVQPSLIGDSYDDEWHEKYLTDDWGRILYDEVVVPAEHQSMGGEQVLIEEEHIELQPRVNHNYDSTKEYIPRSKRKEWAVVGLMGKLYVRDDGKCKVNEFCKTGDGGIAVPAENGYRVMKRVSDSIIQILIK